MTDETTPEVAPAVLEGEAGAAPRRRGKLGALGLLTKLASAGLVGFTAAAMAFLSQTAAGQRMVLDELLGRVRAQLVGDLVVGGIRSQTLVAGATLLDLRLDAEGGQQVLEADSLVLRYSLFSFLTGNPRVSSATLHGLALDISRGPADELLNVERVLAEGRDAPGTPGAPSTIELGRVSVRGGRVTVLTPATERSRVTIEAPDGTPLRRLAFENLDLDLEETMLRPGGAIELDARLTSFSGFVHVVEEPLLVQAAIGDLTFGAEGIRIGNATFRLPGSLIEGQLGFGPEAPGQPWTFSASLTADEWGDLADLHWIDPRITEGRFRGAATLRADDGLVVGMRGLDVQTGASELSATGDVRFDEGMTLSRVVITASPLALVDFGPWVEGEIPLDGFVSGQATLSGEPNTLHVDGRLAFVPTGVLGSATTADISGTFFTGDDLGADDLEVRIDPLNFRLLEPYWPPAAVLGEGTAVLEIDGSIDDGVLIVADVTHGGDAASASRVFGEARLRREDSGEWITDVRADLAPLSLALVGRFRNDLELQGWVSGPVRLAGPSSDLGFQGDLTNGEGRISVSGAFDAATPGEFYTLDVDVEQVALAALTARVPESSVVSGHLSLRGAGLELDSLEGSGSLTVRPSRIGSLRITSAVTSLRTTSGLLHIDSLDVDVPGARITGGGSLGLAPGTDGATTFAFSVDSLAAFRPMLMGDSILVGDGLSPLEEDLMRVRGIEPDTLPTELDVRMTGSAWGHAVVRGQVRDLGMELSVDARDVAYRHNQLDSARVVLSGSGLRDLTGDWLAQIQAFGIEWESRSFAAVDFQGTMSQRRGEGTLNAVRRLGERYFVTGSFAFDSLGGELALTDASVQIDDFSWVLSHPGRLAWDSSAVHVDSLELTRLGDDPSRLTAQGTLARGGESNFRLDVEGFHVEDAMRILQREDIDIAGHVDLSLTVLGPAENPTLDARFQVQDPRYFALRLGRLNGSVAYRDRSSDFRVDAWDADRNVLSAFGTLPLDLALVDVEQRTLDEAMNVQVTAESLPASIALAYFATLEDVAGTISADLRIEGTSREPEPSGTIRLANGAWTITALGVRHTELSGQLDLRPDRTVGVEFGTAVGGRSTVSGEVVTVPFSNPTLDLLVSLDRFQAVGRRDIESMLSGSFTVRGEYALPVAEGQLRVDQGTLFVDEFARSAAIVDLRDPTLFADGFAVDTTVFMTQPILAGLRNPFLDNLRVNIDLDVPRDLWLRSNDMNVEIAGDLIVRYDRAQNDLVMVGDLQATRGSYQVLGRTFEVDGGTVSFLGQPGVNPALGIQAVSRVRRREGDRLEVRAAVTGTLVQPLVTLSTNEAGLTQSDLVSYLLVGVPGGELGAGGANAGLDQGVASGLTLLSGAFGSQLGTAIAQGVGFDYFAISQGDVGNESDFLRTAQFEVGRYIGDDVFVVVVLSCPTDPTGAGSRECGGTNLFRGARVELALSEEWFLEGFYEDRLYRGTGGLIQAGLDGQKVVGLLVFRDWGYGSQE